MREQIFNLQIKMNENSENYKILQNVDEISDQLKQNVTVAVKLMEEEKKKLHQIVGYIEEKGEAIERDIRGSQRDSIGVLEKNIDSSKYNPLYNSPNFQQNIESLSEDDEMTVFHSINVDDDVFDEVSKSFIYTSNRNIKKTNDEKLSIEELKIQSEKSKKSNNNKPNTPPSNTKQTVIKATNLEIGKKFFELRDVDSNLEASSLITEDCVKSHPFGADIVGKQKIFENWEIEKEKKKGKPKFESINEGIFEDGEDQVMKHFSFKKFFVTIHAEIRLWFADGKIYKINLCKR